MLQPPLDTRLERYLKWCRTLSFDPMLTVLKIHQKDAKEAASWGMEYQADDGSVYGIEVIGQTARVDFT